VIRNRQNCISSVPAILISGDLKVIVGNTQILEEEEEEEEEKEKRTAQEGEAEIYLESHPFSKRKDRQMTAAVVKERKEAERFDHSGFR
jgi:hypothetical protein